MQQSTEATWQYWMESTSWDYDEYCGVWTYIHLGRGPMTELGLPPNPYFLGGCI